MEMAFKKQKNRKEAITLFGNQKILDALTSSKIFDEAGINLAAKDCITVDEAVITLRNDSSISYLLIFAEAFVGIKNGLENAVEQLRREFHSLKIAIFFSKERPTEEFQNKAFGLMIFNLYYAEDGNFDFGKVIEDLLYGKATTLIRDEPDEEIKDKGAELLENEAEGQQTKEAEAESKPGGEEKASGDESEKEADKAADQAIQKLQKEIEALKTENQNLRDENSEVLKLRTEMQKSQNAANESLKEMSEFIEKQEATIAQVKRQAKREKEALEKAHKEEYSSLSEKLEQAKSRQESVKPNVSTGQYITIGVFSASRGAGATFTAASLAEKFAKAGFKTACVAYDGKSDFGYLGKSKVDYYFSENESEKRMQLTSVMSPGAGYRIIIIDFGNIVPVDSDGRLMMGSIADTENDRNELFRCNMKVGLCFNSPWDINKLLYFNNENAYAYNTIFGMVPYSDETADMFQNLKIAERDSDVLYICLSECLGLNTQKTKKKGLLR